MDINLTRDLWNEMEGRPDEVVVWAAGRGQLEGEEGVGLCGGASDG